MEKISCKRTPNGEQPADAFQPESVEQLRVLKLVPDAAPAADGSTPWTYQVELWQQQPGKSKRSKTEWAVVDTRTPLRLGKPLPLIPFVFHGPKHSLPHVDKLPLADIIAINLDHYRLNADYKHGFILLLCLPHGSADLTKLLQLRIGSSTAWVAETPGATAGYLEFHGQGLMTFERAMTQDEQLMAVLGSRMMEEQKRVGETAASIELRQSGENAVLVRRVIEHQRILVASPALGLLVELHRKHAGRHRRQNGAGVTQC
jgi:hypothetical protein